MNPKIKRKLKVYNDRYRNSGGFRMEISEENKTQNNKVILFRNYKDIELKLCTLTEAFGLYPCVLDLEDVMIPLVNPGPIQDFLYYGMAILEDLKGDQK